MHKHALVFTALGDETRLALLARLSRGGRGSGGSLLSISRLTEGMKITRQAITKHLRVLEDAGLVRGIRRGRLARTEDRIRGLIQYISEGDRSEYVV